MTSAIMLSALRRHNDPQSPLRLYFDDTHDSIPLLCRKGGGAERKCGYKRLRILANQGSVSRRLMVVL